MLIKSLLESIQEYIITVTYADFTSIDAEEIDHVKKALSKSLRAIGVQVKPTEILDVDEHGDILVKAVAKGVTAEDLSKLDAMFEKQLGSDSLEWELEYAVGSKNEIDKIVKALQNIKMRPKPGGSIPFSKREWKVVDLDKGAAAYLKKDQILDWDSLTDSHVADFYLDFDSKKELKEMGVGDEVEVYNNDFARAVVKRLK